MKSDWRWYVTLTLTLMLIAVTVALVAKSTEQRGMWTFEDCRTNACIANLLNSLPPERASEAKLTTWQDVTYVWYQTGYPR